MSQPQRTSSYLTESIHAPGDLQHEALTVCLVSCGGTRWILSDPFVSGQAYLSSLESAAMVFFRSRYWHRVLVECPRRIRLTEPIPDESTQDGQGNQSVATTATPATMTGTAKVPYLVTGNVLPSPHRQGSFGPSCVDPITVVQTLDEVDTADNRHKVAKAGRVVDVTDRNINVLSVLRGSLAFSLQEALAKTGFSRVRASFMSAQRSQVASGIYRVEDAAYVRLTLSKVYPSIVLLGDIVASGTTLKYAIHTLAKECKEHRYRVSHVILFTIGCSNATDILLQECNPLMKEACEDFVGSVCVFYEGIFTLASTETKVQIKTPGTDFLLLNARLSDEFLHFLAKKQKNIFPFMQQCIVYDGGKRAFSPTEHYEEVLHYFAQVYDIIEKDQISPLEYIRERWEKADEYLTPAMKSDLSDKAKFLASIRDYMQKLEEEMQL